ncbi:MAG: hypothetical protein RLZZ628_2885 [Bacteroidota bacterium]
MSKGIALLRGIEAVPKSNFLNYSRMTDGELDLHLRREYALLLLGAHPEHPNTQNLKKGIEMINDALYKGLHGGTSTSYFRGLGDGTMYFARAIAQAKSRATPAGGILEFVKRTSIRGGEDPLIQIDNTLEQCKGYLSNQGHWDSNLSQYVTGSDLKGYDECQRRMIEENEIKRMVNDHLEQGCPKWLYLFEPQSSLSNDATTKFQTKMKIADHQRMFSELSFHTKLSQSNLRLWTTLGVGRATAKKNIGVLTPEQAIGVLKSNSYHPGFKTQAEADAAEHIGDPITLICIAVIIFISATAAAGIIQTCQGKEPTAFGYSQKVLADAWNAVGEDWLDGGGSSNNNTETEADKKRKADEARRKADEAKAKAEADAQKKQLLQKVAVGVGVTAVVGGGAYYLSK